MTQPAQHHFSPYRARPAPPADRPAEPIQAAWRNGVVVRVPNWLGDCVMCLPAVHRLRQLAPPDCGLFVVCPQALAPVWRAVRWVDRVVPFSGRRVDGEAIATAQGLGAGIGVVLPNSFGAAWDLFRIGTPQRIGCGGRARDWLLTHRLPAFRRESVRGYHQASHYLGIAAALGPIKWDLAYPALAVADADDWLAPLGMAPHRAGLRGWLALAPGAAYGPAKQWPVASFRRVAQWWCGRGGRVVALGTAGERELAAAAVSGMDAALNLAGRTSLAQLMAVLTQVDAVVANDSGTMHLAAALGTAGVAVFGSTDAVATGPLGDRWVVLDAHVPCAPCFARTCRLPERDCRCLQAIDAVDVCAAIEWLLAAPAAAAGAPTTASRLNG